MLRVGLTGGLATGKSFVAQTLGELGCHIIQADELGHQVLLPEGEAYRSVIETFGAEIQDGAGLINRKKLAALVFGDEAKLARLNALVHPAVGQLQRRLVAEIAAAEPDAIVVVEAAILVETGSYKRFDRLIVVVCTPELQMERAMARGFSREEALARMSRQLPDDEKKKVADFVIDTAGTKQAAAGETKAVYRALRELQT